MITKLAPQDPRTLYPVPPFDIQPQEAPGRESEVRPEADHGEATYQGSQKLIDRVAVITGGDSGIGRAVALAFAREGADVVISYLSENDDAAQTQRLVEESGRGALAISGDIGDPNHCRNVIEAAINKFGRLDFLINNAAYQMTHSDIQQFSPDELERSFRTNLFSMFYLTQEAVKHMTPGSVIINTASVQAYQPSHYLLAYAASKGAIVNFTKALSAQLIENGIRVNAVAPGPVWTPLIPSTMPNEKVKSFGADSPMKRPAQPAELAPVYVFLASPEASYVTGMVYGVTGGEPID